MSSPKTSASKNLRKSTYISLALSATIALPWLSISPPPSVQAQSRRVRYVPPSNLDAPKVSVPGITRSAGCNESRCLIGLVPNLESDAVPAVLTISASPTFYFLIPKTDGIAYFRLFEVDANQSKSKRVYRTSFKIKNKMGIVAFKMSADAPILKPDQDYIWEFTVGDLTDTETVRGSIRRVSPSAELVAKLKITSAAIDRAALFAEAGIWFETLQALAEVQQKSIYKNRGILTEWNALLSSANLNRVIPHSFVKLE
jgi:hypothetical protein